MQSTNHEDALNAITAGKANADILERRIRQGTIAPEEMIERIARIRLAFERLTMICLAEANSATK